MENEKEKKEDNKNDIPIEDNKENNKDENIKDNNNKVIEEIDKNLEDKDNNLNEEKNNNIEDKNNNLKDKDNNTEEQNNNIEDNDKINNNKDNNTNPENIKNLNIENNIKINNNNNETKKIEKKEENQQILLAVQKYFSLLIIEFKEHLQKYNVMFSDIVTNTNDHFEEFSTIIEEYCEEISANQTALYEMISKMTIINDELPQLEELYYKVREIRIGLDKMYKEILKNNYKNSDLNNKK